jgi:SAM-dependent methyltransferase
LTTARSPACAVHGAIAAIAEPPPLIAAESARRTCARRRGATSARKCDANRRNARPSTGPRTSASKARSAQNARRHGLSLSELDNARRMDRAADAGGLLAERSQATKAEQFSCLAMEQQRPRRSLAPPRAVQTANGEEIRSAILAKRTQRAGATVSHRATRRSRGEPSHECAFIRRSKARCRRPELCAHGGICYSTTGERFSLQLLSSIDLFGPGIRDVLNSLKTSASPTNPTTTGLADAGGARPCPACGRTTDHRFCFRMNGCDILQCRNCGIGRTETSGFDPVAYYTEDYFSGRHADGYSDYVAAEPVLRREFARSVEFIRRYRQAGTLLEVGCAYGFFLMEAARYFEVAGIELAADAAGRCRRAGLNVLQGMADEANLRRIGRVDVIALFDVIEHLPDPRETLALCSRHLDPGGIIVLTTGDFGSLMAKLTGANWRLMTPPQHLWFFTQESIRKLSSGIGLAVEHIDHPWKVVPASLIAFQLRRMLGRHGHVTATASRIGVPINLFDAMRVVLRKAQ